MENHIVSIKVRSLALLSFYGSQPFCNLSGTNIGQTNMIVRWMKLQTMYCKMKYVSIKCKVDGNANDFPLKSVLKIQF